MGIVERAETRERKPRKERVCWKFQLETSHLATAIHGHPTVGLLRYLSCFFTSSIPTFSPEEFSIGGLKVCERSSGQRALFGLVMGWLRFQEAGRKYDCINNLNSAHPVPVHVEEVDDIVSVSQYILVVEKESVFQRLANDKFCRTNRCIVITGRGYPDIPTRRFLRLLIEKLHLPAYCLVDCDPYGFDILTTYRFGSMQMAYDAKFLRVPEIRWLGVFPSDSEKYDLPQQCLLPLTAEDKKKTEAMLLRCYLQREELEWRLELELMLQRGVKFEIEALSVHSLSYLSKAYIPSKIQGGAYI